MGVSGILKSVNSTINQGFQSHFNPSDLCTNISRFTAFYQFIHFIPYTVVGNLLDIPDMSHHCPAKYRITQR